jgi:polyferredoxin
MEEYKFWQQKRKIKQLLAAVVFIFILILGWQYPLLGYFIPLCMFLGIIIGLVSGRKWCDWYCPRGSFYDAFISNISPKRKIPTFLKSMYFRISLLSFLMLIMTYNLIRNWPNPYKIGMFFVTLITTTTVLGIILAIIFHQRSWCMFCPIGTIVNLIGRNKRPLRIDSDLCVECKLCAKVCPVQLEPYIYKGKGIQIVKEGDCLKCGLCVAACPTKALK